MRKTAVPMAAALAVGLILPLAAQAQMLGPGMLARGLMRNRQAMGTLAPPAPPHQTLTYGHGQSYDFYPPLHPAGPTPLVLFVHGGAWVAAARIRRPGHGKPRITQRKGMPSPPSTIALCPRRVWRIRPLMSPMP
jgi:hypothetical protein